MSKLASRLEEWRAKQAEIAQGKIEAPKASTVCLGEPVHILAKRLEADLHSHAEIQDGKESCKAKNRPGC